MHYQLAENPLHSTTRYASLCTGTPFYTVALSVQMDGPFGCTYPHQNTLEGTLRVAVGRKVRIPCSPATRPTLDHDDGLTAMGVAEEVAGGGRVSTDGIVSVRQIAYRRSAIMSTYYINILPSFGAYTKRPRQHSLFSVSVVTSCCTIPSAERRAPCFSSFLRCACETCSRC